MAKFIRGQAIPNAIAYELLKQNVATDGSITYETIDTKTAGRGTPDKGYIDANGEFSYSFDGWNYYPCIDIARLVDRDGYCAKLTNNYATPNRVLLAFYADEGGVLVRGYTFDELVQGTESYITLTVADIQAKAYENNAKYVAFSGYGNTFVVNATDDIFFRLDDIGEDLLPSGQTHYLVVKAIAHTEAVDTDGNGILDTRYDDSDYGGKNQPEDPLEPVEYTPYSNVVS